jgi:ankyrin repeat protein
MLSPRRLTKVRSLTIWLFTPILLLCPAVKASQNPGPETITCKTPLIVSIESGDTETARHIIETGKNINDNSCGVTALTESIAHGDSALAEQLVLVGADSNESDIQHISPLMYAAFYCQYETASLLIEHKARINELDDDGESALMYASANCDDGNIVALLIRVGAKVNLKSKVDDTALTLAAMNGDEFGVKELVAAGANVEATNFEGETALSIAQGLRVGRKPAHDRICAFLIKIVDLLCAKGKE